MPMNNRLMRPRQTLHPEALDWRNRVVANGGSVSGTTLSAVDRFVKAIHAAGIRDRFYRLSLLCGNNLLAAQIPLFRSTAAGGVVLGNTLDVNTGMGSVFVDADYSESSGLQCSGDAKTAALELAPRPISNLFPAGNNRQTGHLSATYIGATSLIRTPIGVSGGASGSYIIQVSTTTSRSQSWGTRGVSRTATASREIVIQRRDSNGEHRLYVNGSQVGTSTGASTTNNLDARFAAGGQGDVTPTDNISGTFFGRLMSYSVGDTLNDTQATAYHDALAAFLSAIGR